MSTTTSKLTRISSTSSEISLSEDRTVAPRTFRESTTRTSTRNRFSLTRSKTSSPERRALVVPGTSRETSISEDEAVVPSIYRESTPRTSTRNPISSTGSKPFVPERRAPEPGENREPKGKYIQYTYSKPSNIVVLEFLS